MCVLRNIPLVKEPSDWLRWARLVLLLRTPGDGPLPGDRLSVPWSPVREGDRSREPGSNGPGLGHGAALMA